MICLSDRGPIGSWSDDGVAVDSIERAVITVWIVSEFTMCFIDVYERPYEGYDFLRRDLCTTWQTVQHISVTTKISGEC